MGLFITFEGPEGCGKSTQVKKLETYLSSIEKKFIITREPGGSFFGNHIREIILSPENTHLCSKAELFLYLADRAQHVSEKILPYLQNDYIVISDRFADATIAYQGYGRNMDIDFIKKSIDFATSGLYPDLTFFIDINPEAALKRAISAKQEFSDTGDRMEKENMNFHNRVYNGYKKLIDENPERYKIINGELSITEISNIVIQNINKLLLK